MYLISIIIPVFNVENIIEKTFNSIYNQTIGFENLEVILVDDNSTDSSKNILLDLSKKYDNVKVFSLEENSGNAGKPRNIGLKHATADYIMFLDSDDQYIENACEILYEKIKNTSVDMVSGTYIYVDGEHEYVNVWDCFKDNVNEKKINNIREDYNFLVIPPSIWTKIYKKELIIDNNILFDEKSPAEDLLFIYNVFFKAEGIIFINEPITKYIKRNEKECDQKSITNDGTYKVLDGFLNNYDKVYNFLYENDKTQIWPLTNHLAYWTKLYINSTMDIQNKLKLIPKFLSLYEHLNNPDESMSSHNEESIHNQFIAFNRIVNYLYNELESSLNKQEKYKKELSVLEDKIENYEKKIGQIEDICNSTRKENPSLKD